MNNKKDEVIAFIATELSIKPAKISLEKEIGNDFGVDGDDAAEFIEAFAQRFEIDLTGFVFNDYTLHYIGAYVRVNAFKISFFDPIKIPAWNIRFT